MENNIYWIWLASVRGIQNNRKHLLVDAFGGAEEVYTATKKALVQSRILKDQAIDKLIKQQDLSVAQKAKHFMEKENITCIHLHDALYPQKLVDIYDPPVTLFAKGDLSLLKRDLLIGMVGSRKASPGSLQMAKKFGEALSNMGMTVVSGMAEGIDAQSHRGALAGVGSTIAVLGTGVNRCYPRKNANLYREIEDKGLLLSEFFMDEKPLAYHFPLRNRIISGLSDGLLVVEAAGKSGALITAKHAMEQGKNVYAIPQDIHLDQSVGSNALLQDGAKLVTKPEDILEDFVTYTQQEKPVQVPHQKEFDLTAEESELYQWMKKGHLTIDDLVQISGQPMATLNAALMMMELKDCIKVEYGQITLL